MGKFLRKNSKHYLMLLPFLILFIVFFVYPIGYGIYMSFFKWDGIHTPSFIGINNYQAVFKAKSTIKAYSNLLSYVLITVPLCIFSALVLALIVHNLDGKFKNIFKCIYFLPAVIPTYLAASIWRWLLATDVGLINSLLAKAGLSQVGFLTNPKHMITGLIIVDVWCSAGFNMLILLAGLEDIPTVYYDAARVDGANKLQEIIFITIPQLWPSLFFTITYGWISALQVFEVPWILTSSSYTDYGGIKSGLLFPVMDMLGKAFGSLKFGASAAYGVVLTFVILLFTVFQYIVRAKIEK